MGPVRAAVFACTLVACGAERVEPVGAAAPAESAAGPTAAPAGDLLLARARLSIDDGVLAPELEGRILSSTAPEHAHAQRLLTAMRDGVAAPPADDDDPLAPTRVPEAPVAPITPAPPPTEAAPTPSITAAPATAPATPAAPAATPRAPATLERVSMQSSARGASLTIQASSGVLVGVVNQPEAGIVRLALDDVRAAPKVLSSRPGVTGARVRSIDASKGSVRITLALEPGWRFGGVRKTAKGAKVELLGPS